MPSTDDFRRRRSQRGQTILLIAVSMVSLLAMAALAIDVVTLYVARTEVQRAADAAALAGAKALADSGVTTLQPADAADLPNAVNLAESMARSAINAVVAATPPINPVAGSPPTLVSINFQNNLVPNNNPIVTVVLQQTNLPTFFARIWGASASTTSASATAEAYNPSNSVGGSFTPITPRCVKPWLVANLDPTNPALGTPFINVANGAVFSSLPTLTATPFFLTPDCKGGSPFCSPRNTPMQLLAGGETGVQYLPALVTQNPAADTCPACADTSNSFEEGTACCNAATYSCGGDANNAFWDSSIDPKHGGAASPAVSATQCLINATDTGQTPSGQDTLEYPFGWPGGPPQIAAGTNNPMIGQNVTTSRSIVTIPIIPPGFSTNTTGPVTVVGFLQAFVNYVNGTPPHVGDINITVMNVVGCSTQETGGLPGNGNPAIVGGNGASVIPVRLITPP